MRSLACQKWVLLINTLRRAIHRKRTHLVVVPTHFHAEANENWQTRHPVTVSAHHYEGRRPYPSMTWLSLREHRSEMVVRPLELGVGREAQTRQINLSLQLGCNTRHTKARFEGPEQGYPDSESFHLW